MCSDKLMSEIPATYQEAPAVTQTASCWKQTGSFGGNRKCDRLADLIHCRNCAVYQQAAHTLLDRPPLKKNIARWTEQLAAIPEDEANGNEHISIVIFQIGNEWFGLPTERVGTGNENCRWRRIPHRSGKEFLGLMAVRGELVLYFSLHAILDIDPAAHSTCTQVLVCGEENRRLAFSVKKIGGERRVALTADSKPPVTIARAADAYTRALVETEGCPVAILDADSLFRAMEAKAR
jgi:chemotaxis-related protein WspD